MEKSCGSHSAIVIPSMLRRPVVVSLCYGGGGHSAMREGGHSVMGRGVTLPWGGVGGQTDKCILIPHQCINK